MAKNENKIRIHADLVLFQFGDCAKCWCLTKKTGNKFGVIVKWSPATLLTPQTPTGQLGVELLPPSFNKHGLSIEFDYGFRCAVINNFYPQEFLGSEIDPKNFYSKHYSKYHMELRKYFRPAHKKFSFYMAVEALFIPYTYSIKDGWYRATTGVPYTFDFAHASKSIKAGDVKFGFVVKLKLPITIEGFVGVGLRKVDRYYSVFTNRQIATLSSKEDNPPLEGESIAAHLALGIRVGYRFQFQW